MEEWNKEKKKDKPQMWRVLVRRIEEKK